MKRLLATSIALLLLSLLTGPLAAHEGAPCVDGIAGTYPCHEIDLAHWLDLDELGGSGSTRGSDIWGWTDTGTGREFALVALTDATAFVEVTDPQEPIYLGSLPTAAPDVNVWRDVKTYNDHAFIVADFVTAHGMQVFDLSQLLAVVSPPVAFSETANYAGFERAHNIVINEATGTAYGVGTDTCTGGLHMIDIQTPTSPSFLGCFDADGYTHDAQCVTYAGPDTDYQGQDLCFNSNTDTLTIVNVTDPANPVQISRNGYTGVGYTHQGWLTDDHAFFLLDDETDEQSFGHNTRTYIWDLADLDLPVVSGIYEGPVTASDHNLYVRENFAFLANYRSGLRILNIEDIANGNLSETAYFDTVPGSDAPGFSGAWSSYPYFESGTVIVSDTVSGLFVLRPTSLCTAPTTATGLTTTPAGDNQIDLAWTDDALPEETYRIYRSFGSCPGGAFELIADSVTGGAYSDTTASGSVDYAYEVRKVDLTGGCESTGNNCANGTTTGVCNAPPIFSGVTSVDNAETLTCRLDVAWDSAVPNCGSGATYSVYRSQTSGFTPSTTNRIANGLSATTWPDSNVLDDTTYYYVTRATDDGSGVEDSNLVERAALATGPAADGTFSTGAEIGDPGLGVDIGGRVALKHAGWHLSDARAHLGDRSFFSEYTSGLCSAISTPAMQLTTGESSELSFWTVYDIEDEDGTGLAWDGGVVELSTNGTNWQRLELDLGYPTTWRASSDACSYATGSPAFSGLNLTWVRYAADLSPWAGLTVSVRWNFSTDGAVTREGWYIDDIEITHVQLPGACSSPVAFIFGDDFESGDLSGWGQ